VRGGVRNGKILKERGEVRYNFIFSLGLLIRVA
jgi:hypothetical protein